MVHAAEMPLVTDREDLKEVEVKQEINITACEPEGQRATICGAREGGNEVGLPCHVETHARK